MFVSPFKMSIRLGTIIALGLGFTQAALDFNTYRILKRDFQVKRDGKTIDSTEIIYELTRLGSTSLEASSLTLTSHGSYLSVIEEATLTGNIEDRPHNITQDFIFQGSLPIPALAAVHALSAIHSDTIYQAKLHKMTYSLNDVFFDTTALKVTLNSRVAFLQQLTDRTFEATFSKLSLGEPVRVRIEYDIPFSGAPGTPVHIPVLFHPSGTPPRQAQITFFEKAKDLPSVQWLSASGNVTLTDSGTHTVAYQNDFIIRRAEQPKTIATLQATTFESGKLKGNYLLFKGGLTDSLMNLLSRPLEVTFLWRWNQPYQFVEVQNGLKTISALGQTVALEAKTLKQIIQEMAPRGHRFGLMRSAPGYEDAFFAPAEVGTDDYKNLLVFLDQFTEERLYADYKDFKNDKPIWATTVWTDSGEIVKSRNDFLSALGRIRKSFSQRPEALYHIEMLGFGAAPATVVDLKDPKVIEAIIDSVTLSNILAPWLGVDIYQALELKANQNLLPLSIQSPLAIGLPPLLFPVFQPTSVEYRAFTPLRTHAVVLPFSISAEREAMIKAAGPFEDTLQLQGIDALGRKTRILTLQPRILRSQADLNMARLWAADPDRISEESEVDLGMRYGILTKGTYWGAGIEDAASFLPNGGSPQGTPILPKLVRVPSGRTFQVDTGMLRIAGQESLGALSGKVPRLEVYDLQGKQILMLNLAQFRTGTGFALPMELLLRLKQARLYLVLRGTSRMQSFVLNMGGRI